MSSGMNSVWLQRHAVVALECSRYISVQLVAAVGVFAWCTQGHIEALLVSEAQTASSFI